MFWQAREEHVEDVDMTHKVREQSPSRVEGKRKEEHKKNPKSTGPGEKAEVELRPKQQGR